MRSLYFAGFALATLATIGFAAPASADALPESTWTGFVFGGVGSVAAPDFTFVSDAPGDTLTVTDAFLKGDSFDVYDFGALIGSTSMVPASSSNTTSDPDAAFADPTYSHGVFALGVGAHDISLVTSVSPFGGGGAYLRRDPAMASTPEPGTVALLCSMGLTGAGFLARRKRTRA